MNRVDDVVVIDEQMEMQEAFDNWVGSPSALDYPEFEKKLPPVTPDVLLNALNDEVHRDISAPRRVPKSKIARKR